ncbi:FAD binding domain-containing protein [Pigmentiphaga soli]|uniref:FAD binding domain-containing protein n=1 Tax=Pigmentiphaga soli TaxID=1007095 RepID=A0ABP8GDK0_9BURK
MKSTAFAYRRAQSLAQAAELAGGAFEAPKFMAGGQSLMPMMNLRLAMVDAMIDISRLPELRRCCPDGDGLFIGAGVTHAMIEDGRVEDPARGYLRHVAGGIAYRSVRNRGTVGGSLAHADPAADWPTALRALDAVAVIRGAGGERRAPLAEFQLGLMETSLQPGEILLGVVLPVLSAQARWSYRKFCRKSGEFAHSIAAVVLDPARGMANAVLGAASDRPQRLQHTSAALAAAAGGATATAGAGTIGAALTDAIERDLAAILGPEPDPYDQHLHRTLVRRAAEEACQP